MLSLFLLGSNTSAATMLHRHKHSYGLLLAMRTIAAINVNVRNCILLHCNFLQFAKYSNTSWKFLLHWVFVGQLAAFVVFVVACLSNYCRYWAPNFVICIHICLCVCVYLLLPQMVDWFLERSDEWKLVAEAVNFCWLGEFRKVDDICMFLYISTTHTFGKKFSAF